MEDLQYDMKILLNWFKINSMKPNPKKFQFMILGNSSRLPVILKMNNIKIRESQKVMLLGLIIDNCWRTLLWTDKASLLETIDSLKIRNFGYTQSCLRLLRKSMFNFRLFFLYSSFSYFWKFLTVTFLYFRAISL